MTGRIEARLQELGVTLPTPPAPVASYVPFQVVGNLVARLGAGLGRRLGRHQR